MSIVNSASRINIRPNTNVLNEDFIGALICLYGVKLRIYPTVVANRLQTDKELILAVSMARVVSSEAAVTSLYFIEEG